MKGNLATVGVACVLGILVSKLLKENQNLNEDIVDLEKETAILAYENDKLKKALKKARKESK